MTSGRAKASTTLGRLAPGDRFRVVGLGKLTGTLVKVSLCRARVKLDGYRNSHFTTVEGAEVDFSKPVYLDWSPGTRVERVGP